MIKRDQYGIICQHSKTDPNYLDGGDSARSTAIMALAGSDEDKALIGVFESAFGTLVRHPHQVPWNNPNNFTRDQTIPLMAIYYATAWTNNLAKRVFTEIKKRGFRAQNTEFDYPGTKKPFPNGADIFSPADVFFLAVASRASRRVLVFTAILGIPWFILALLWATRIKPMDEQNQIICQCLTFGRLTTKLYTKLHPDYKAALLEYWGGWRDQIEIATALIDKIERTVR